MEDQRVGNQGCTKERRQHSKIVTKARNTTAGGVLIGLGQHDEEHCLLDKLRAVGALGNEEDARTRYDTGYKLRGIYYDWKASGKSISEPGGSAGKQFETEHETPQDEAEQLFHSVMKATPTKYHKCLRFVCLSDGASEVYDREFITDSLDALYGSFYRIEKEKKDIDRHA